MAITTIRVTATNSLHAVMAMPLSAIASHALLTLSNVWMGGLVSVNQASEFASHPVDASLPTVWSWSLSCWHEWSTTVHVSPKTLHGASEVDRIAMSIPLSWSMMGNESWWAKMSSRPVAKSNTTSRYRWSWIDDLLGVLVRLEWIKNFVSVQI